MPHLYRILQANKKICICPCVFVNRLAQAQTASHATFIQNHASKKTKKRHAKNIHTHVNKHAIDGSETNVEKLKNIHSKETLCLI